MDPARAKDRLTWWGHATVRLDVGGLVLLTDPVLRGRVGPLRRRGPAPSPSSLVDVTHVLLSHLHHDHLDLPSLRRLPTDALLVVPRGGGAVLRGLGARPVREVVPGDVLDLGTVTVEVVGARHPGGRTGTRRHGPAVGHLVRRGDRRGVYVSGDTGRQPEVEAALRGRVSVAVLPVGGWGATLGEHHLGPADAAAVAASLRPDLAVPYHWGTLTLPGASRLSPGTTVRAGPAFVAALARLDPSLPARVLVPGQREDLPVPT